MSESEAPALTVAEAEKLVVKAAERLVEAGDKFRRAAAQAGHAASVSPDEDGVRKADLELNRAVANLKNARKN